MHPLDRSTAGRAPGAGGGKNAPECHGSQDQTIDVAGGDGTPVPEIVPETDTATAVGAVTSSTTDEVATGGPTTTIGLAARTSPSSL
jgi:hypothetical protein